jgi:hypothetical protein
MAKLAPAGESTLNTPPPPDSHKHAASLLHGTPSVVAPSDPPAPAESERRVSGAWRWNGTEYRWIPARNEKACPPYEWKRP